jgi:hypothetical protein
MLILANACGSLYLTKSVCRKHLPGSGRRRSVFEMRRDRGRLIAASNVAIAVGAGAVGYRFHSAPCFFLFLVFAVLASLTVLSIAAAAIDYNRARDLREEPDAAGTPVSAAGYSILFKSRNSHFDFLTASVVAMPPLF